MTARRYWLTLALIDAAVVASSLLHLIVRPNDGWSGWMIGTVAVSGASGAICFLNWRAAP